ncbi:MAG: hypothetical protein KDJ78_12935 [Rhodobacteraceae bacterium]|uniref:hypothetical protein n=1 Tax=Amaricoccus sp. TaxID=1872485 RepID=UPI001D763FB4|nr:hypothetical protein [Amaricoccus sp.]MCB1375059.1 hypothetical protein [Paracoccaceae bacterium]MCC0067612.1 hypothetical protein [Rhodovulum sp.]HRW15401.1 hypothetical protein [Amaricoccus sp.]
MASVCRTFRLGAVTALALVLASGMVLAQSSERVRFAAGNDNAAVEAEVTGDAYRDYVLGAAAGQTMAVSLITDGTAYFNILPPGSDGAAIFVGSNDGMDASVELPDTGDYTIRVYLMGNDKDSGQTVPFTLSMTIM